MTPEQRVARAARKAAEARQELEYTIREAREAGLPLRTIATLAGLSHESVRRICPAPKHPPGS